LSPDISEETDELGILTGQVREMDRGGRNRLTPSIVVMMQTPEGEIRKKFDRLIQEESTRLTWKIFVAERKL
jgi:hypothetical protein